LAASFDLSQEERDELLPSGRQRTFENRVGWARTYLKNAWLLEYTKRGHFRITKRGEKVLADKPKKIDAKFLEQFPEFVAFRSRRREKKQSPEGPGVDETKTPEERLEEAHQQLQDDLAEELLNTIVSECSPAFFEQLVVELLLKMGYGGSRAEAGKAIGRSGDEGIDGVIREDRLGLDVVYIQAKRWKNPNPVGRKEIQSFAGALQGQRARKGIFITTSTFTRDAVDYVTKIDVKIALIDGERLAQLMIEHDLGVSKVATYETKKIDMDYFAEG
jgi:restriction system protein